MLCEAANYNHPLVCQFFCHGSFHRNHQILCLINSYGSWWFNTGYFLNGLCFLIPSIQKNTDFTNHCYYKTHAIIQVANLRKKCSLSNPYNPYFLIALILYFYNHLFLQDDSSALNIELWGRSFFL